MAQGNTPNRRVETDFRSERSSRSGRVSNLAEVTHTLQRGARREPTPNSAGPLSAQGCRPAGRGAEVSPRVNGPSCHPKGEEIRAARWEQRGKKRVNQRARFGCRQFACGPGSAVVTVKTPDRTSLGGLGWRIATACSAARFEGERIGPSPVSPTSAVRLGDRPGPPFLGDRASWPTPPACR